jgi:hypothetical protein
VPITIAPPEATIAPSEATTIAPPEATTAPPEATPPLPVVEIEDGVIEEARRRQRRRRKLGIALGAAIAVIGIAALLIGGGGGHAHAPGESSPAGPLQVTLVHGHAFVGGQPALMGVTFSLQAGNVGVCVRVLIDTGCNGPYPSAADPVYGGSEGFSLEEKVGPAGEIDAIFTGPSVAALRVAHLGTFRAEPAAGLPPGAKQIVFYRPPGSRGSVLAPGVSPHVLQTGFEHVHYGPALTETLLDASGHPIPVGKSTTFMLPSSYWQSPQEAPLQGRCAISSSLAGVRTAWGIVATKIAADPNITTPGWLTCLNTWFSAGGASYEAAVLLNARSPGRPPAMLWGAIPIPGHPGMVEIPPVQQKVHYYFPRPTPTQAARELAQDTKHGGRVQAEHLMRQVEQLAGKEQTAWDVFVPSTVARRVGPAWLLVRYGNSLAERIRFLEALHVTKIELGNHQHLIDAKAFL